MLAELQPISRLQVQAIEADDAIRARNIQACDELLALLSWHHPEHGPKPQAEEVPTPASKPEVNAAVSFSAKKRYAMRPLIVSYRCWVIGSQMPLIPWHLQNRIKRIQQVCAKEFGVKLDDMFSERRTADVVRARQVAMWVCKTWTVHSYPEIGDKFGGRDHTTVLHAVRRIEKKRQCDPDLADAIQRIVAELNIPVPA